MILDTPRISSRIQSWRKYLFEEADCFMLCIGCNRLDHFEEIEYAMDGIREIRPETPIFLVLTMIDLAKHYDNLPVTVEDLEIKREEYGFQGVVATSAIEFMDNNVQKAFDMVLSEAYMYKYGRE